MKFETSVHGKWILAGEHAVLRGASALVFPVPSKFVQFSYIKTDQVLQIHSETIDKTLIEKTFGDLLKLGLEYIGKAQENITGEVRIENSIPIGVGMGFSAAICVAFARWFECLELIESDMIFKFSKHLENYFHGESSGLDIAGVLSDSGGHFSSSRGLQAVNFNWKPLIYLSDSKVISKTSECIEKVDSLWDADQEHAQSIDCKMKSSVQFALKALPTEEGQGLSLLVDSINLANECFNDWGLVNEQLNGKMQSLKDQGAIATKPTGSGNGGLILSLWEKEPGKNIRSKLTAAF